MIDTLTRKPLAVSTDGNVGPYVEVPFSQLAELCRRLDKHQVSYSVEEDIISLNGGPEVAVVDFGRKGVASLIQAILDGEI